MQDIASRLRDLKRLIRVAEDRYHRVPGDVKLLAVSKGQPIVCLQSAIAAGQTCFAENYLQEALPKIKALPAKIEWHFIGHIQANKTKAIAENFAWVHSVAQDKIALRLAKQRPQHLPPLKVCIQVNFYPGVRQAGVLIEDLALFAQKIHELPGLTLCGLMTIPTINSVPEKDFRALKTALTMLQQLNLPVTELSMGMSADYELAIKEGATLVRIGSALFGSKRRY